MLSGFKVDSAKGSPTGDYREEEQYFLGINSLDCLLQGDLVTALLKAGLIILGHSRRETLPLLILWSTSSFSFFGPSAATAITPSSCSYYCTHPNGFPLPCLHTLVPGAFIKPFLALPCVMYFLQGLGLILIPYRYD